MNKHHLTQARWLRSILVALALIFWTTKPAQMQDEPPGEAISSSPDWETYTSPLLGYSFEYLGHGWILSEETVLHEAESFMSLSSVDNGDIITIVAMENPERLDTSQWVAQSLSKYDAGLVEIQNDVVIRLAGYEGRLITQPESCNSVAFVVAVFTVDDLAFEIGYLVDDVDKASAYRQILASFRLPDTSSEDNVIPQLTLPAAKENVCPQQVIQATSAQRCPDAPFYIPTEGHVMASYGCWGILWCPYTQSDPHKGIDIGPIGADMWGNGVPGVLDVYAPAGGVVIYKTSQGLKLRHSAHNVDTYFAHMANNSTGQSYISVSYGQTVSAGQVLGKMGNYGCSETHLHFNIMVVGGSDLNWAHSKDPTPFLRAQDLVFHSGWDRHPMECTSPVDSTTYDYNRDSVPDLWAINRQGRSDSTEIHIISGADRSKFLLNSSTTLHPTNKDWCFSVADYDRDGVPDLWAIDRQGGSDSTEIHVISGADRSKFLLHSSTALHPTGENWSFPVGDYNRDGVPDLWAVNRQGGSDSTEIHVISGADRSKFLLHSGTALHPTNEDWHFSVADYDQDGVLDLWAIKTQGGSDSTEIHVISGADRSQFLLKSSTALPNTNKDWRFLVTDYDQDGVPDLWAIDRQGGSDSTEIHIISGADRNKFLLYSSTALHPTNENWCFGEGECATDLADEYSIYLPILHKP